MRMFGIQGHLSLKIFAIYYLIIFLRILKKVFFAYRFISISKFAYLQFAHILIMMLVV